MTCALNVSGLCHAAYIPARSMSRPTAVRLPRDAMIAPMPRCSKFSQNAAGRLPTADSSDVSVGMVLPLFRSTIVGSAVVT
jgi:hypothetical protein